MKLLDLLIWETDLNAPASPLKALFFQTPKPVTQAFFQAQGM